MQERVEAFILKCENEKVAQEKKYRDLVMEYAGLISSEDFVEATEEEYQKVVLLNPDRCKIENDVRYIKKKIPLEISEDEFAAIEKAIPAEKLAGLKSRSESDNEDRDDKSWASMFFTVIAWILWIGGLIISIVNANVSREVAGYYRTYTETSFSFQIFITAFISYFVYGCVAMCAAELFKKLQTIVNLLKRK